MKPDSELWYRLVISLSLVTSVTALALITSATGFYALLSLWNAMAKTGLQIQDPTGWSWGLGLLYAVTVVCLLGEEQYRFVFETKDN